jgi:membrane-associated PAP2 superfamily phosphatase
MTHPAAFTAPADPPPAAASSRRDLRLAALTLLALLAWDAVGWDLTVVRHFADASGFAWREHWLAVDVFHQGGRAVGFVVLGALILNVWRPLPFARDLDRAERLAWLGATLVCLLLIPLLKQASRTSCPWSLAEFGGTAQYVSHWAFGVDDGGTGGCFPSGHASAAFSFLPGWLALRARAPRASRAWLIGVVAAGLVFGAAQMVRGAHYPSHTLWTGWICLAVSLVLHHVFEAWRARR